MSRPIVLIYTEPLLARSMTFIRTQAEALASFIPYYIGPSYLQDGLPLPQDRTVVMRRGTSRISKITEVPFKAAGFAPFFVRRLRKLQPVLLHAHFGPMGLRALPLARALGIPLIVTFQGYDATVYDHYAKRSNYYSHRIYRSRRKHLDHGAALLIAVSRFIRDQLIDQGFDPAKIVTLYVGVDTDLFCPDPAVKREPVVLFVGRLAEKKGCEYLIRAMAQVQAGVPGMELVVVGDGELRQPLEQLARSLSCRCRFLGFQPPEEVKNWMNRARVFGAPSVRAASGDAEGYPNAFAEAQAMGLPVVSFDSDGVREAVVHGETGLLAPSRNAEALAEHLRILCVNESLCHRMSVSARNWVCRYFNLATQTSELENLYRRAIGARSGSATPEGERDEVKAMGS